jgi:hypothetical protein
MTFLFDRLPLCRELLYPSGSVFVQISAKTRVATTTTAAWMA